MKVRYEFVNGEWSEIEVEDSLGELLVELDRQEYNSGHKETRRHTSLDGMDYEGALFTAPDDPAAELVRKEDAARLRQAMEALSPAQRELVRRVYFENEKITDIICFFVICLSAIELLGSIGKTLVKQKHTLNRTGCRYRFKSNVTIAHDSFLLSYSS